MVVMLTVLITVSVKQWSVFCLSVGLSDPCLSVLQQCHCSNVHRLTPLLHGIGCITSWTIVGTKTRQVFCARGSGMRTQPVYVSTLLSEDQHTVTQCVLSDMLSTSAQIEHLVSVV